MFQLDIQIYYLPQQKTSQRVGGKEIADFLTILAVERKVSASTQNQALNALVFLYKKVLKIPLNNLTLSMQGSENSYLSCLVAMKHKM